jgi:AAA+ superfamily predicted ATPase
MSDQANWADISERHLMAAIRWLRLRLEQLACAAEPPQDNVEKRCGWFRCWRQKPVCAEDDAPDSSKAVQLVQQELLAFEKNNPPPALLLLARTLGLSSFDQNILLLCAAMEQDSRIAGLCAKAQGNTGRPYPTFALALELFENPNHDFLSLGSPLRHWRLLEINQQGTQPLISAALRLDERILGFLKGNGEMDARLNALLDFVPPNKEALPFSLQTHVDSIAHRLRQTDSTEQLPVIELLGHDAAGKKVIAAHAAAALGLELYALEQKSLPSDVKELELLIRLWEREYRLLRPVALLVRADSTVDAAPLRRFLERSGVVFLDLEDGRIEIGRDRFSLEISKPTPEEQEKLWIAALNGPEVGGLPQRLAEQFSFAHDQISRLARQAVQCPVQNQNAAYDEHVLWQLCRSAARSGMERLAQRIEVKADRNQLILPDEQNTLLDQIIAQVHQRNRVYDDWGFRQRMNRGLGINALFSGESGTGKTMAAEVIAKCLDLDMYRIDLSTVVSKYIGETEKNLRKLFDAAEDSGAILFFDEADALFGKRSEVKDSHDRYANIEVNYLLQRMETYRGLAILASNVRTALDKAFLRRLRFIVEFPFPGPEERKRIWEKVFPKKAPAKHLDDKAYQHLAKLNLTGGSIHNVALNAAFLAAEKGSAVTMPLILAAARTEFRKIEKPFREADFQWKDDENKSSH